MESSIEASQTVDISKPKLTLKPRLAPKPFSLQKNTTIRSIHAPKTVTANSKTTTQQSGKSEAAGVTRPTAPAPALQPTTALYKPVSAPTKDQPKITKESPHGEDTPDSSVAKSSPAPQPTPRKEPPKSEPILKENDLQTNHQSSTDIINNSHQRDGKNKEGETQTSGQKVEESASGLGRRGSRKRLSMELTSKFESGGPCLPPQPSVTVSTTSPKDDANKPESSDPQQSQTPSEPSNRASDEGGLTEEYSGGGSIKRRISLLFDSASRPEVTKRREEPEMMNGTRGVKARIKNWVVETSSEGEKTEKKPQVVPRIHSESSDSGSPPTAEKTTRTPPAEAPAMETSTSQAVDLSPKVSPAKQHTETPIKVPKDPLTEEKSLESPREHVQSKSTEGGVQLRHHTPSAGDSAESESAQPALRRDNVKRRSVRFGVVERDDGGPTLILGSASDSSEDEEKEADTSEEDIPVSVPVYRGAGSVQKKDDEEDEQEAERLKHLEFEKKRRAEEVEEARRKLEEEQQKRKEEEEEREKEMARQREEEERKRERLKEEERERQRKEAWERERLKEEREKERKREEEREKERQMELIMQRQREEEERERERQRKEEVERERLKEETEKERKREEEREKERQMELIMQRQREEEEREREKQRNEEVERERLKEEREKERKREEEREKERQMELIMQRQREEEEKEREKQRNEEVERERLKEEREKERKREEEREKERQMELIMQRQREEEENERERQRKEEAERERLKEKEKERKREEERVKERQMELIMQRQREEEREKEREIELMMQRQREEEEKERERQRKEEVERERLKEEREKESKREEEREKERQRELAWQRQREEEERERAKKEERLKQDEERERKRLQEEEEEKQREEEWQRQKEERERMRQKEEWLRQAEERERREKEEEMERMRRTESEKLREEERRRQVEKERVEELERRMQEELRRKQAEELEDKSRVAEEKRRYELTNRRGGGEPNLISFDSEDVPPYSPSGKTWPPSDSEIEVAYDDFSVRNTLIDVEFDDFSVKPQRWGTQTKKESSPAVHRQAAAPMGEEQVEMLVPVDISSWENKVPERLDNRFILEPILSPARKKEEEPLIQLEVEEEKTERDEEEEVEETPKEDGVAQEDVKKAQPNSYGSDGEDKDTDALIDVADQQKGGGEADQQNEACEQTPETDSPKPDGVPEVSSEGADTTDLHKVADLAPFPESCTPLLDTSAQRSKANLSKRRIRSRPSRSLRASLSQRKSPDWRTRDSTEETEASSNQRESDSEDEKPKEKVVCSPPPTSQRVPIFPGLSPAALLAQLKRRTSGAAAAGEETEEKEAKEEQESPNEEVAPSPMQLSHSPRPASHLAGAARVLPPIGGTDGGSAVCPAWLKELKSKKRLSQYESEA